MSVSNSSIEKIENLLRLATNERQRKMYQNLLDKARKSEAAKATASGNGQENHSQPSSSVQDSLVPLESPLQRTDDKSGSQSKTKTKQTKKSQPALAVVNEPAPDQSKKKSSSKQKSNKQVSSSEAICEAVSFRTSGKDKKNSTVLQVESTLQPNSQQQSVGTVTPIEDTQAKTSTDKTQFFQAVGLFRGIPQLKDDKLCVERRDREFDLTETGYYWHKDYGRLKQELELNGSREMLLRVYPKIAHHSDNLENPYQHSFSLVRAYLSESEDIDREEEFVFRGIWQYVPYCSVPVISIHRNIDTLKLYKRLPPAAQRFFIKPQAFPVVWDAPVEPFRYNPELEKSEQMPRYFVEVKAIFENGQYTVIEMLNEPTIDIPKYIKPLRKKSQPSKSDSDKD